MASTVPTEHNIEELVATTIEVGPLMDHLVARMDEGCEHSRSIWLVMCIRVWSVDPVEMVATVRQGQRRRLS